jgi:hypothetical protein
MEGRKQRAYSVLLMWLLWAPLEILGLLRLLALH